MELGDDNGGVSALCMLFNGFGCEEDGEGGVAVGRSSTPVFGYFFSSSIWSSISGAAFTCGIRCAINIVACSLGHSQTRNLYRHPLKHNVYIAIYRLRDDYLGIMGPVMALVPCVSS